MVDLPDPTLPKIPNRDSCVSRLKSMVCLFSLKEYIPDNYSVNITAVDDFVDLNVGKVKIKIITSYKIAIRVCELKNIFKISMTFVIASSVLICCLSIPAAPYIIEFFAKDKEGINNYLEKHSDYEIKIIDSINSDSNYVCRLNKEEVLFPIRIRNRRDGDKMIIKGLNGSKKIKDIFINEKIDKDLRDNWPIVVDSNDTIVWLPGLKKSKFDKAKNENYDIILWYN